MVLATPKVNVLAHPNTGIKGSIYCTASFYESIYRILNCIFERITSMILGNATASSAGIINNNTPGTLQPPVEYQTSTLQIPHGEFSILSELREGNVTPLETMATLVLGYRSNWSTGRTWRTSTRLLASLIGISHRYLRDTLNSATDWITRQTPPKGNIAGTFQLTHHQCDPDEVPTDKEGYPLSFAVPRGDGGIFEALFNGDIDWKSALIWIILKKHSDWTTGITNAISMERLAKWVHFGKATVVNCIRTLQNTGLLKRLSKKHECSVFQLYPKPYKERKQRKAPKKKTERQMRAEGVYRYSLNEKYRLNTENGQIEHRKEKNRGQWKPISDYHRYQEMPKAILKAFDIIIEVQQNLNTQSSPQLL